MLHTLHADSECGPPPTCPLPGGGRSGGCRPPDSQPVSGQKVSCISLPTCLAFYKRPVAVPACRCTCPISCSFVPCSSLPCLINSSTKPNQTKLSSAVSPLCTVSLPCALHATALLLIPMVSVAGPPGASLRPLWERSRSWKRHPVRVSRVNWAISSLPRRGKDLPRPGK